MTAIHNYAVRHPPPFQVKMEDSSADREERKREYNRLAQREFRRRRKEHLKNLEQLQKEQTSEQSGEIERLRHQNEELKRENEALKQQMYGVSTASHQYQMPATLPSNSHAQLRSYSVSPSLSSTMDSMSGAGSPPSALHHDLMHPMPLGLTSSILSSSMQAYADMPITTLPSQSYPMVNSSGARHNSQSSQESSDPNTARPSVGSSFQSLSLDDANSRIPQRSPSARPNLIALVPYDRQKARTEVLQLFTALLTNPSALSQPTTHLSLLGSLSPSLPSPLKPTRNQLTIPHYYGIDLLSSPALRDRLISVGPELSEQFVSEISSCKGDAEDLNQLVIWGEDPLNEMSWEFSGQVLARWGWLLGRDWVERANFWRRQRGAQALPDW